MEVWKPRQERLPRISIAVQTRTKTPYSNPPIQRARKTWLAKAMNAEVTRTAKAVNDMRAAWLRSPEPKASASNASRWGRARAASRSGKMRSAVVAAETRTL